MKEIIYFNGKKKFRIVHISMSRGDNSIEKVINHMSPKTKEGVIREFFLKYRRRALEDGMSREEWDEFFREEPDGIVYGEEIFIAVFQEGEELYDIYRGEDGRFAAPEPAFSEFLERVW